MKTKINPSLVAVIVLAAVLVFTGWQCPKKSTTTDAEGFQHFSSDNELVQAFQKTQEERQSSMNKMSEGSLTGTSAPQAAETATSDGRGGGSEFSETNVQVAGVDEADIVKTDGTYIYALAQGNLVINKAYPAEQTELVATVKMGDYLPDEMFIEGNRLLIFGTESVTSATSSSSKTSVSPRYRSLFSVRLYDISNPRDPKFVQRHDFEGSYVTARKIAGDVYFVFNTYPTYRTGIGCAELLPGYKSNRADTVPQSADFQPIVGCTDVGYVEPLRAQNFITVASLSMTDDRRPVQSKVMVGSGQDVYASPDNLYVAQTNYPTYSWWETYNSNDEKTIISKFNLDHGLVTFQANGEVPGHILNQFSMDEFDRHFRIATTVGQVWNEEEKSKNNIYILDSAMKRAGALEDLAPGETIYSARFMGERGYLVTFKKVDPLFVVDLSEHRNPRVLGKLKIPGYSDYLHPYDANHIIGIGKEAEDASTEETTGRNLDFAWYQGLKMALFDVTDVEHPVEMYKEVIGDRGTDSPVLNDHKAFLFDKKKALLVLPISLAEIQGERSSTNQYGNTVYQGAYVYDLTLENGFKLRGRITHVTDESVFVKSGYYLDTLEAVTRSLYIENVLYTLSPAHLKANRLDNLNLVKEVDFPAGSTPRDNYNY